MPVKKSYKPPHFNGLNPAKIFIPPGPWKRIEDYFQERFPEQKKALKILNSLGEEILPTQSIPLDGLLYIYRCAPYETPIPFEIKTIYEDEHLLVIDKPAFLATYPRGSHLRETVITRLRLQGYDEISAIHRLDRLTSGVLALSKKRKDRGKYHMLFHTKEVHKKYRAIAELNPDIDFPITVENRLFKDPKYLQVQQIEGENNAKSTISVFKRLPSGLAIFDVTIYTGKFHQIRAHMNSLSMPIMHDPFYPVVLPKIKDDFTKPLTLLSHKLSFTDPISERTHTFTTKQNVEALNEK